MSERVFVVVKPEGKSIVARHVDLAADDVLQRQRGQIEFFLRVVFALRRFNRRVRSGCCRVLRQDGGEAHRTRAK